MVEEASTEYLDLLPKVRVLEWQNLDLNSGSPVPKVLQLEAIIGIYSPMTLHIVVTELCTKQNGRWQKEPL